MILKHTSTLMTTKSTHPVLPVRPTDYGPGLVDCITNIKSRMVSNRLMLDPTKMEVLWLSMPRNKHLTNSAPFTADGVDIAPNSVICLFCVLVDETLSFDSHISHLVRNCYYQLRRIKAIRCSIPTCHHPAHACSVLDQLLQQCTARPPSHSAISPTISSERLCLPDFRLPQE